MTSRVRRQLQRVAKVEAARRDREATRIAADLRAKYGVQGKPPEDPEIRRELYDEINRSPLAAEVRDKLLPPIQFNLTAEQMAKLAHNVRTMYGDVRTTEELKAAIAKYGVQGKPPEDSER